MFGVVATVKVATPLASPIGDSREAVAGSEFYERLRRLRQKKNLQWKPRGGVLLSVLYELSSQVVSSGTIYSYIHGLSVNTWA